jgi:hypothetical protein
MAAYYQRVFDIMQEWAIETGATEIDVDRAAEWAIANKKYQRLPISAIEQCKRDMRRSLQQSTYTDPQGNEVRTMHAVRNWKGQQMTLWIDVRTAKPDVMFEALKQSHNGVANDVKRLAIEKHSYDLNNPYGATLPELSFDFTAVAEEAKLSGEYDDTYDEDFDGDLD